MQLELQRLLARGVGGLSRYVIVDVGAILRRRREVEPAFDPLPRALAAARRSHRKFAWLVAPVAYGGPDITDDLRVAALQLQEAGAPNVVTSSVPLGALLAVDALTPRLSVVTAGLVERPYELWLVGKHVENMLDVETGVLWDRKLAERTYKAAAGLPEVYAIVGADGREVGLGGKLAGHHREVVADIVRERASWTTAKLPTTVRANIVANETAIAAKGDLLRGGTDIDTDALEALCVWSTPTVATTAYVAARVTTAGDAYELHEVAVVIGDEKWHVHGEVKCAALLASVVLACPKRWFAPRALDLLAAMADRGLATPAAVVDPGLVAFAMEPGEPPSLSDVANATEIPPRALRWMEDVARAVSAPDDVARLCDVLEDLDRELAAAVAREGLTNLAEQDLARTLPALARMERMGAWVDVPDGYRDWTALAEQTELELQTQEHAAEAFQSAGLDIYASPYAEFANLLETWGHQLPSGRKSSDLTGRQRFNRLVHFGINEAKAVKTARSLAAESGSAFWLKQLSRPPAQLRGRSVPQLSGRWAARDLPLQNVPKRSLLGRTIRSGLVAPQGHVLVGADQNAFEVRLLADLSGDPNLLRLCRAPDVHAGIATHLFGVFNPKNRELAKLGMYAALYGQEEAQFRRARYELTNSESVNLYRLMRSTFSHLFAHRDATVAQYQRHGELRTRGGWLIRKRPGKRSDAKARSIFNATVQGLGADIQRWVLRELDAALPTFNARVVHQAHDEVFIAVPDGPHVSTVANLLVETMTTRVMRDSRLLTTPVQLVAKAHVGRTWRDML